MKSLLALIISLNFSMAMWAQMPVAASGIIKRHENFQSKFVTARNIDVWLPDKYSTNKKYNVLYMHDGQMLFDSNATWNHQAWEIDDVIAKLNNTQKLKDVIVAGIWNGVATRHPDYFPQKPYAFSLCHASILLTRTKKICTDKAILFFSPSRNPTASPAYAAVWSLTNGEKQQHASS